MEPTPNELRINSLNKSNDMKEPVTTLTEYWVLVLGTIHWNIYWYSASSFSSLISDKALANLHISAGSLSTAAYIASTSSVLIPTLWAVSIFLGPIQGAISVQRYWIEVKNISIATSPKPLISLSACSTAVREGPESFNRLFKSPSTREKKIGNC